MRRKGAERDSADATVVDEPPLADLLARARTGEQDAAAELVQLFEPEVRRFVRYRLTDPYLRRFLDSLDITQSVFARFFARLADGHFQIASSAQLCRLLDTMALNELRDQARRAKALKRLEPNRRDRRQAIEEAVDPHPDPYHSSLTREFVEQFRARLPSVERELLDAWMDGQPWNDIAARLGGTPEGLRKRLSRAVDEVAAVIALREPDAG